MECFCTKCGKTFSPRIERPYRGMMFLHCPACEEPKQAKSCEVKDLNLYVVLMRRWGDVDGHTYIAHIGTDREIAEFAAKEEREGRAGKYEYQVMAWKEGTGEGIEVATSIMHEHVKNATSRLLNSIKDRKTSKPGPPDPPECEHGKSMGAGCVECGRGRSVA